MPGPTKYTSGRANKKYFGRARYWISYFIKNNEFAYKKQMILYKNDKFANKKWKGVKSEKIKVFPLVWSKYLSSWTGLGRSGHVQITTWQVRTWPNHDFCSNFACFGFKIRFLTKFYNESASFLPEKLKNHILLTQIPKINSKSRKLIN